MKHALTLSAVALLVVVLGASALAQERTQPQQPRDPAPIQGELSRVDADTKLIAVKIDDGSEVQLAYDDATEISGAKDGAAGLATMTANKVTVHFKEDAQGKKLATRILVEPKK